VTKKTKVLIVDDHPLMRNALEASINIAPDMEVVAEATTGLDALALVPAHKPDIILMDLMMPKMDGFEAISALCEIDPDCRILVLSSATEETKIVRAIQSGAMGYITKNAHRDELVKAIRSVAAGETYLPPKVATKLINRFRTPTAGKKDREKTILPLSDRENEVFDLLGQGISNLKIAETLFISKSTVRVHLRNIIIKRGYRDRHEAVMAAVEERLKTEE
jgi:DNA-binding NarL/FixJ family response regulator